MTGQVNIPLLRKAVEWAEAEAVKPPELREWDQQYFKLNPDTDWGARVWEQLGKAPECGTCYCIAGWVAAQVGADDEDDPAVVAADALGISPDWMDVDHLFSATNSIEDVRRIAEQIAGERL